MTYQQNSLIQADDFNTLVGTNGNVLPTTTQLNSVWGIGTRNYGYGQTPLSTVAANTTISHTNWSSLITTLQTIVNHQGGVFPASLVAPVPNDQIKFFSDLSNTVAAINNNRLNAIAQGTTLTLPTRYTTAKWNNVLTFNHTITFESADKARYFFNAGGQIAINFTHSATSTKQDLFWNGITSSCGTIYISGAPDNITAKIASTAFNGITKIGGSGVATINKNLGFFNLTANEQLIFQQYPSNQGVTFYYLQSSIKVYASVLGSLGSYGGVGSVLNIKTVWTQEPATLFVDPGNNTGPVNNSTTTATVRFPSTAYGLTSTWGTVTVSGTVTASNATPPTVVPTYNFGTIPNIINEGSLGTFNVTTTNVSNGTVLYWTIKNITTSSNDFTAVSGNLTINNNSGSLNVNIVTDSTVEVSETFQVELRTGSITGNVVATSNSVSVNNSTPSAPTYAFSSIPTSIAEGSSGRFIVSTTNVPNGTTLYWVIGSYDVSPEDFTATNGSFTINNNSGTITVGVVADAIMEGPETFNIVLKTGSINGPVVRVSDFVTITQLGSVTFGTIPAFLAENSSGTFNVTTSNIANGTIMYWTIDNITTSSTDFSFTSGSFTVFNNSGSFTISTVDEIGPPPEPEEELFRVQVRTGSISGNIMATSASVKIIDPGPRSFLFTTIPSTINEGSSGTFVVTTTGVISGTTLYWTIGHISTVPADFSTNSGSFTVNSGTGSFSVNPVADAAAEGPKLFLAQVRLLSTSGTVVAESSPSTTVVDTSRPPSTYKFSTTPSSVNEGSSGTFVVTTTDVANGTTLWWVIENITTGGDFGTLFGSFTINSNTGTFSVSPSSDGTTEGAETFRVLIKTGSQTGTTVATSASVTVNDISKDVTYNYAPEWLDEFAASYGYVNTTARSILLTLGQQIANAYYLSNSTVVQSISPQPFNYIYGLYRKPDAAGLAFWADYAYDNGLSVGQTLANAFFRSLVGQDQIRSRTASKSFDAGTGDGDFYDRSVP